MLTLKDAIGPGNVIGARLQLAAVAKIVHGVAYDHTIAVESAALAKDTKIHTPLQRFSCARLVISVGASGRSIARNGGSLVYPGSNGSKASAWPRFVFRRAPC